MITLRPCIAVATLLASAQAPAVPPPPIVTDQGIAMQRKVLNWMPGEVRCGGQAVAVIAMPRPLVEFGLSPQGDTAQRSYRFRIDAAGRPLSIVQDKSAGWHVVADDLGPMLAATRFGAGAPRVDCVITFTAQASSIDDAAVRDLMAYSISPISGRLPPEGWKRIAPAGSTCMTAPRPAPLNRAFPDFDALPATPGAREWSMIGYDLDARGRPVHLRIVEGTGNRALDAASMKAVRGSRFTGGARAGCLYPYWRAAATLAAPQRPDPASLRPENGNCPGGHAWAVEPKLTYPAAWRRRAIEGWAAIAYDVAPWGGIGNVRVLASEPAAAFGQQALQIVQSARKAPSQSGASGCVEMIRFVMDRNDMPADGEAPGFGE
ncbi:TonB family protein [Sphingomonas colocasiae]|uniref:Energy transducer TonB n=1 Tax=Sphingomonas colocasiae TaxID=1848973 RepID=A0ABS7PWE7_9SPHN|nr:TonB family protein [Sphingomonas colocasiae]MBY8824970.1 energy transducer TonB [Sphingomonas colocasiae]